MSSHSRMPTMPASTQVHLCFHCIRKWYNCHTTCKLFRWLESAARLCCRHWSCCCCMRGYQERAIGLECGLMRLAPCRVQLCGGGELWAPGLAAVGQLCGQQVPQRRALRYALPRRPADRARHCSSGSSEAAGARCQGELGEHGPSLEIAHYLYSMCFLLTSVAQRAPTSILAHNKSSGNSERASRCKSSL